MRQRLLILLAAAAIAAGAPRAAAQDPLSRAKELYGSAEYENALSALDEARQAPGVDRGTVLAIEEYRALCLLAMQRRPEAEQAIEAVIDLDPFYFPGEEDASPWVRAAFREVRRRVLPATLQQIYGRAKEAFERKAYGDADADFRQVLRVLDDPDLSLDEGTRADMRLVVQAFMDLARAAGSAPLPAGAPAEKPDVSPPSPAAPAAAPSTAGQAPDSAPPAQAEPSAVTGTQAPAPQKDANNPPAASVTPPPPGPVYDSTAADVAPPVPERQSVAVPEESRPAASASGVVEIVVAPDGSIESASVVESFGEGLDQLVLHAVRAWRYRPAVRAGVAVRYRRLVRIVLPTR